MKVLHHEKTESYSTLSIVTCSCQSFGKTLSAKFLRACVCGRASECLFLDLAAWNTGVSWSGVTCTKHERSPLRGLSLLANRIAEQSCIGNIDITRGRLRRLSDAYAAPLRLSELNAQRRGELHISRHHRHKSFNMKSNSSDTHSHQLSSEPSLKQILPVTLRLKSIFQL